MMPLSDSSSMQWMIHRLHKLSELPFSLWWAPGIGGIPCFHHLYGRQDPIIYCCSCWRFTETLARMNGSLAFRDEAESIG